MIVGLVRFCVAIGCPFGGKIIWPTVGVWITVRDFCFGDVSRAVSLTCSFLHSFVTLCVFRCVAFVLFSFCMGVGASLGSLMLGFISSTAVIGVGGFSSMWSNGFGDRVLLSCASGSVVSFLFCRT